MAKGSGSKGAGGTSSPKSLSTWLSATIPTLILFWIFVGIFLAFRKKQKRVYAARNVVETVPEDMRPGDSPRGLFSWVSHLLNRSETFLINHSGVDGYFFLRFLFQFVSICFIGCVLLWPILFPVNATGGGGQNELDILSMTNIQNKWRFFAHVFLSWLFFGAIIFIIYRELVYYITFRHVLQTTPLYDSILSSRTLLLTHAPESILDEAELRKNFPTATNVWYARDYKELDKNVGERSKLANKYEGALNKVIKKAVSLRAKCLKKNKPTPEPVDDLNKYLKDGKKRPTHRLKFLIGEKVDTLNYGAEHLGELNKKIKKQQLEHNANTQIPSVFIEFPTQLELQKAYQAIPYNKEFKSCKRFTSLAPGDILWPNLALTPAKRRVKKLIANTLLTLMIIFWNIPVAFAGAVSNINTLISYAPWLAWINNCPPVIMGLINGLFPVIVFAVLMMLVPIFIKKMGKVAGLISVQEMDRYCQNWYYAFQVVNGFMALSLSSAAMSAAPTIVSDPGVALNLLKQYIPKASNIFLAYVSVLGLSLSSGLIAQVVALILAQFLGKILDGTPRKKWTRWNTLGQPGWATIYPGYQILTICALGYALISPLILGFATIAFALIYIAFVYTLNYVMLPYQHEARGRNYVSALFLTFVTLYISELWLTAMFVFSKNWACVVLEAVFVAFTAICHIYFKRRFLPLTDIVPISAIKYASGDSTFEYPAHDQGLKEIKVEGEHYWQGGNQLGLSATHDQVLPDIHGEKNTFADSEDIRKTGSTPSEKNSSSYQADLSEHAKNGLNPGQQVGWIKRFFNPRFETFDLLRKIMPTPYFNYIEYNEDFLKTAYEDPAVTDEEPHIWIPRDEMGLSEIEKNKALENGVDVSDENATFNEKNDLIYTGPPPSYEEALKV